MIKTKWNEKDIRDLFNELDKMTGADSSNVKININPRLKRTIARYRWYNNSRRTPYDFEFGTQILNVPDKKALYDVAIHEYAHYIINSVYKLEGTGHTPEFRKLCKKLGTDNKNAVCTSFVSTQLRAVKYGIDLDLLNKTFEKEPKQEKQPVVIKKPKQVKRGRTIGKFDLNGNLLETGKSSYFKEQGYQMGNVSKCCNGKLKTHKGFAWKYLD